MPSVVHETSMELIRQHPSLSYRNEFVESFYENGMAVGMAEGHASGWTEGMAVGRAEAFGDALLKLLKARGIEVGARRGEVDGSTDVVQLQEWFTRALTARNVDEVFGTKPAGAATGPKTPDDLTPGDRRRGED